MLLLGTLTLMLSFHAWQLVGVFWSLRTYMRLDFWQEMSEYYVSFEEVLKAEVSHCHQVVVTKARGKKSGEESFAL
jgi:hypothetical protein